MNLLNGLTLIFSIIRLGHGFLLDGNQQQNHTSIVYNQYLTIDDKVKIERELEDQHRIIEQQHQDIEKQHQDLVQLKDEQTKTINILTSQLRGKLTELETKIQSSAKKSLTCDHITSINNELQNKMSLLENKTMELETLREKDTKTIEELYHKTIYLENKVGLLENATKELKDLKGVQDLQNLKSVETTLQTLELKVTTLASREQARSDDFLALHNMTENLRHAVYDKNTGMSTSKLVKQVDVMPVSLIC